ncbi:hypothetical protein MA16_Dca016329 [Dendrobium catenatum]|uniref:Zinc knuckle CX2CX4HX4C domain-containing protein n=1 Tax=Dendrobium catenatum TaxID=906689 RepID=A0A2I0W885_9ASPA|nr:hypothetical protein MA16_Dca016329 [Dendrobium catenatum]
MVGKPILLDGNMFQWGRREFRRVCVRIKLDKKLPVGVWVEGANRKFYQKIEYERIPNFCFGCGFIGHSKEHCGEGEDNADFSVKEIVNSVPDEAREATKVAVGKEQTNSDGYGPWMIVNQGRKVVQKQSRGSTCTPMKKTLWKKMADKEKEEAKGNYIEESTLNNDKVQKEGKQVNPKDGYDVNNEEQQNFTRNNSNIPFIDNKFDLLNDLLEEGEISNVIETEKVSNGNQNEKKEEPKQIEDVSLFSKEKGEDSSRMKKKKSKQLKDLGPINNITRSRRLELDVKGKVGADPIVLLP